MLFRLFGGITRTHRATNATFVFNDLLPNTPQGGTSLSHTGRNAHMGGSNFIFSRGLFFYPSLVTATSVSINITTSKKDPFRKGIQIILGAADAEICPPPLIKALQIYFKIKNSPINSPFFSYQNGKPLSHKSFTKDVRNLRSIGGLDPTHYDSHSFRIGAATGLPSS